MKRESNIRLPLGKRSYRLGLTALALCVILGSSCGLLNKPPAIESLTPERKVAMPAQSTSITCIASDPDGDELSYQWTASGGNILEESPSATWTAPDIPGIYTITATVTDGQGGKTSMALAIEVVLNDPPVIESLTAESPVVRPSKSTSLACVAADPDGDELSYQWTATDGSFSGQGANVTWAAPEPIPSNPMITIMVEVTDGRGGAVSKELSIKVIRLH